MIMLINMPKGDKMSKQKEIEEAVAGICDKFISEKEVNDSSTRARFRAEILSYLAVISGNEYNNHLDLTCIVDRDDPNKMNMGFGNLYTALMYMGIYCNYEDVKDLNEYTTPDGTEIILRDGDIIVKPSQPLESIEFTMEVTDKGVELKAEENK